MKLVKKALAGMMALAMAATAMVSLTVTASADELPALYPVITVDENAKTATIEVRGKNLPTIIDDGYDDPAYIFSFGCTVDVSSFATESIYGMSGRNFNSWKNAHFVNGYLGFDALQATTSGYEGFLSYGGLFTSASSAVAKGQVEAAPLFFTVKDIPLSDDALANGFTVAVRDTQIIMNNEYWGTSDAYEVGLKTNNGTAAAESATWTPSTPVDPDPEPYWVDATVEDFTSEVDNSVAVAAKATLSAADAEGESFDTVTWKVTKDEVVKGRRSALKTTVEGEGTVTVGLAIGGINSTNLAVQAALGAWGN